MSKSFLKIIIIFSILAIGFTVSESTLAAQVVPQSVTKGSIGEVLYYVDTGPLDDGQSSLFQVNLDPATGHAILTLLPNGILDYDHVDVLAATPDGSRIYFIDDGLIPVTSLMGYYDIASATVSEVGPMQLNGNAFNYIDQGAFSHDGVLYVTNTNTDKLYTVDLTTAEVTEIGDVIHQDTGAPVNIGGGDIAFSADGTLYLWVNIVGTRGLYTLSLPVGPGIVYANLLGSGVPPVNGLAVRANGFGDVVASSSSDEVYVLSKLDGQEIGVPFMMYLDGSVFNATFGDMTTGPLAMCTRTIGYYKNHSWSGATITVLGVLVDQVEGQGVLWNARGKNFSMLFAQLIAAKLNTNNATGLSIIDDAEAWLENQDVINPDGTINWFKEFDSKDQKGQANQYKDALDAFNNSNECNYPIPDPCPDPSLDTCADPSPNPSPDPDLGQCWVASSTVNWCELAAQDNGQVVFIPIATQ